MGPRRLSLVLAFVLAVACAPARASAEPSLVTLDEALLEARRANAGLPVPRLEAEAAAAAVAEAKGRRLPSVALDGDFHTGFPARYASNDARAQLVAGMPIYDGGRLRAGIASGEAGADGARAGYHQAELDLDREVRAMFATCLEAEQEIAFRRAGVERLRSYRAVIDARRAGGQGVASDLARTSVRVSQEEANVTDAERRRDEIKLELNTLMGRAPDSPLELSPLPPPETAEVALDGAPWRDAPEIAQAEAAQRMAAAGVTAVHADRLPQISLMVDGGMQPVWGRSKLALLNNGEGWGGELLLSFNLQLWDAGVHRSRVEQAELAERSARQRLAATQSGVHLSWQRAVVSLHGLRREVAARARAAATARDSYLQVESLYRGGVGSALDVLTDYDVWIGSDQALAEAVLRQRIAEADLVRWGTP